MKLWITLPLIIAALLAGCAGEPAAQWQKSLATYIEQEGAGDPAVLRNLADDQGRITFHHFGRQEGLFTKSRTDVDGLLVGTQQFGGAGAGESGAVGGDWLIFLLARVRYAGGSYDTSWDYPHVQTIRAAALRADDGDGAFTWRLGPADDEATMQYVQPQHEAWRISRPQDELAPVTRFPTERDRFTLTRAGTMVTILDEHSGARWTIDLAAEE